MANCDVADDDDAAADVDDGVVDGAADGVAAAVDGASAVDDAAPAAAAYGRPCDVAAVAAAVPYADPRQFAT